MNLPLTIPLRVSRYLVSTLAVMHLLAIGAILPLMLAWPLRLLMIGLVLASLLYYLDRQFRQPVVGLHLGAQGEIEVEIKAPPENLATPGSPPGGPRNTWGGPACFLKVGARETATILPQTTVLSKVIVLRLRKHDQLLTLPLLADATGNSAFRQLSLWLKWRASLG